jgi:hypothetical protein
VREVWAAAYGWYGAKVTVDFNSGNTHTLGIGLSATEGGANMSAAGQSSISSSAGARVTGIVNEFVVNKVNYRRYRLYGNACPAKRHKWRAEGFYALLPDAEFTNSGSAIYSACNAITPRFEGWKENGTNATYSGGVTLFGFGLSAQAGWNQETKMTWDVTRNSWICGSTSVGWVESPKAEVHARN